MLFYPDYYFYSKYIVKFVLRNKFNYFSILSVPFISKVFVTYIIHDLIDSDDLCSSNYFYFFRFFFGKTAFLLNHYTRFRLNIMYHFFSVELSFSRCYVFFFISFIVHDVLPYLNLKYLVVTISNDFNISLVISDLTLFTEKRTNLGFFGLRHALSCKFSYSGVYNSDLAFCFPKLLKIFF